MTLSRLVVALAVLLSGIGAVHAQDATTSAIASAPAYVVLMQDFSTTDCDVSVCGWLGKPLIDGMLALENNARRKSLQQQLEVLRAKLPGLNLYDVVQEAFCRELMLAAGAPCAQVSVLGPGSRARVAAVTKNSPVENAASTILVKLSVEYSRMMRTNELRVIAAVSQVVAEKDKPLLYIWYVTPGGDATRASPLDPSTAKPSAKQLATDAHWFGQPSLMEAELRQALPEIARMIREMSPYLPRYGAPAKSWDSLPVLADLQAAGKLKCPGVSCKFHVLGTTDKRVWFMQQADAPVVMSAPFDMWK